MAGAVIHHLEVGARVFTLNGKVGTVRYAGPVDFATGRWVGLELDTLDGRNNGSVSGKRYFKCERKRGVFVRESDAFPMADDKTTSHHPKHARKSHAEAKPPRRVVQERHVRASGKFRRSSTADQRSDRGRSAATGTAVSPGLDRNGSTLRRRLRYGAKGEEGNGTKGDGMVVTAVDVVDASKARRPARGGASPSAQHARKAVASTSSATPPPMREAPVLAAAPHDVVLAVISDSSSTSSVSSSPVPEPDRNDKARKPRARPIAAAAAAASAVTPSAKTDAERPAKAVVRALSGDDDRADRSPRKTVPVPAADPDQVTVSVPVNAIEEAREVAKAKADEAPGVVAPPVKSASASGSRHGSQASFDVSDSDDGGPRTGGISIKTIAGSARPQPTKAAGGDQNGVASESGSDDAQAEAEDEAVTTAAAEAMVESSIPQAILEAERREAAARGDREPEWEVMDASDGDLLRRVPPGEPVSTSTNNSPARTVRTGGRSGDRNVTPHRSLHRMIEGAAMVAHEPGSRPGSRPASRPGSRRGSRHNSHDASVGSVGGGGGSESDSSRTIQPVLSSSASSSRSGDDPFEGIEPGNVEYIFFEGRGAGRFNWSHYRVGSETVVVSSWMCCGKNIESLQSENILEVSLFQNCWHRRRGWGIITLISEDPTTPRLKLKVHNAVQIFEQLRNHVAEVIDRRDRGLDTSPAAMMALRDEDDDDFVIYEGEYYNCCWGRGCFGCCNCKCCNGCCDRNCRCCESRSHYTITQKHARLKKYTCCFSSFYNINMSWVYDVSLDESCMCCRAKCCPYGTIKLFSFDDMKPEFPIHVTKASRDIFKKIATEVDLKDSAGTAWERTRTHNMIHENHNSRPRIGL